MTKWEKFVITNTLEAVMLPFYLSNVEFFSGAAWLNDEMIKCGRSTAQRCSPTFIN